MQKYLNEEYDEGSEYMKIGKVKREIYEQIRLIERKLDCYDTGNLERLQLISRKEGLKIALEIILDDKK